MATYIKALEALADPTRRAIFDKLVKAPMAVSDIASGLEVSRPAVSQHLKVLRNAGLVTDRAEGTRRIYSPDPRGLAALHSYVSKSWDRALARFEEATKEESDGDA